MPPSLTPLQQRQRLATRFNYLWHQYENLRAVTSIFNAFAGWTTSEGLDAQAIERQFAEQRGLIEQENFEEARRGLGALQAALQSARAGLDQFHDGLSVYLIRTRYQAAGVPREEVAALLQFLLAKLPFQEDDFDKLDYLATRFYALRCGTEDGFVGAFENLVRAEYQQMLDQAGITTTGAPDPGVMERFQFLRDELASLTTFEQLSTHDTLNRLRQFKAQLGGGWFHPDVLVEIARLNLLAGQRFQELANHERHHIDRLATRLISAGISEIEQPEGKGRLPVEDAREISALNTSLLDQDYRRNKDRLARILQLKDSLERAHQGIAAEEMIARPLNRQASPMDEQIEELEMILDELSPTPERLQQDLRERITQISLALSKSASSKTEVPLTLGGSTMTISPWECAAFADEPTQSQSRETRLRRLLRVSVALMAELQEKVELICRGVAIGRLRNTYLTGARYLVQLSQQTAREIEMRCASTDQSLEREVCEQLQRTRRKLLDCCSQFSAKVRHATA